MVRLEYARWLVRRHISTCTERFVKIQLFEENPLSLSLPPLSPLLAFRERSTSTIMASFNAAEKV